MHSKVMSILMIITFIIVSWYVYYIYPFIQNLVFAILVSTITLVTIIVSNFRTTSDKKNYMSIGTARVIFSGVAMISFLIFFALSMKYGGNFATDEDAMSRYDNYELGEYYLSSHGNFTLVSYNIWLRMKIVELIVIPTFMIMIVWNFIHIVKMKGMKFAITGREKDVNEFGTENSLSTIIGFVLLCLFIFIVVALILLSYI